MKLYIYIYIYIYIIYIYIYIELERTVGRLKLLASQDALLILRSAFGSSKMLNVLRSSPCVDHPSLVRFDSLLRSGLTSITNCALDDYAWLQSSLHIRDGGLGIRSVVVLAPSAFLASAAATLELQDAILSRSQLTLGDDSCISEARESWCQAFNAIPPQDVSATRQRNWDKAAVLEGRRVLEAGAKDPSDRARILAVTSEHAGDWLNALPITSCGLRLDDEAVRIGVGLRLGLQICEPHQCPCGSRVDGRGLHFLSCRMGPGRLI